MTFSTHDLAVAAASAEAKLRDELRAWVEANRFGLSQVTESSDLVDISYRRGWNDAMDHLYRRLSE